MEDTADLWGEIRVATARTPLAILREQASLLAKKTKSLVEARVQTSVNGDDFFHRFILVVPTLDDYEFELFAVKHGIELYPVRELYNSKAIDDADEFTKWLGEKLTSEKTTRILANLLAQVVV